MYHMHFQNKELLIYPMFTWSMKVKLDETILLIIVLCSRIGIRPIVNLNCPVDMEHKGIAEGRDINLGVLCGERYRGVQVNRTLEL